MGRRAPAPPQPSAWLPSRIQASVHVVRPHAVVDLLAEFVPVVLARLAEKPLECGAAIMAHE
eukprot:118153-Alexandrium_andersonii.AAC.1